MILKNHSPQCPYILCNCKSCEKLNYKRLKSFNKRNKEKIELAAALNAKRHAPESGSSVDDEEGFSRRSSFCSKTSTPDMDSETRTSSTTPITRSNSTMPTANGLEGRSGSLGHMTVMSYDIWKAKCASERKRLEEERLTKPELFTRSPSPGPMRKRAHTFVAPPTIHTPDIPVVAAKKMSLDEKVKGKFITLPTIPAMRIFVNEEDEDVKPVTQMQLAQPIALTPSPQMSLASTLAQIPMSTPVCMPSMITPTSFLDIPSTSSPMLPFQISTTTSPMLQRQTPILTPQMSPFKPVGVATPQPPALSNLSAGQELSSFILHSVVLQAQQAQQKTAQQLIPTSMPSELESTLSLLRLQQSSLGDLIKLSGIQLPTLPTTQPMLTPQMPTLPMMQKALPTVLPGSFQPFLQPTLFTNPV